MKKFHEDAKKYLEGFSRDELKELLMEAGFEIEDGPGEIVLTESLEAEIQFTIQGKVYTEKSTANYSYKNMNNNNCFSPSTRKCIA